MLTRKQDTNIVNKPSAAETMAMSLLSKMIGLSPDQLRDFATGIGSGIKEAAADIAELKTRTARIETKLDIIAGHLAARHPVPGNGLDTAAADDARTAGAAGSGVAAAG